MNINYFARFVNLFFLQKCFCCFKNLDYNEFYVCHNCLNKNSFPYPQSLKNPEKLLYLDDIFILYLYLGFIETAIKEFKFYRNFSALKYLQSKIITALDDIILPQYDSVIPIPLHASKLRTRGFNQCEFLYQSTFNEPFMPQALKRVKKTKSQSVSSLYERKININNAFKMKTNQPLSSVLLVDDVITTGATANECAKVLKKNGAKKVYLLALASRQ